jgi:hypothetical protein
MRTESLRFHGTVASRTEASVHLKVPGDAVVIERERPRWFLISCPCGCGEILPVNLDSRAGPAWNLYEDSKAGISLYPSVWRESGCGSHFILWRGKIWLIGRNVDGLDGEYFSDGSVLLREAVRSKLSNKEAVSFLDVAQDLHVVPWDVLTICRALTKSGLAREGRGKRRGWFKLR